jgi:hypothetical protein
MNGNCITPQRVITIPIAFGRQRVADVCRQDASALGILPMSQLNDLIRTHAVHLQLQSLARIVDAAIRNSDLNAENFLRVRRIRAVLKWCDHQIAGADPFLFELRIVDSVQVLLSATFAEISALINDGNIDHLARALSLVNALVVQLVEVPAALAPKDTAT